MPRLKPEFAITREAVLVSMLSKRLLAEVSAASRSTSAPTSKGVLFDSVSAEALDLTKLFYKIRNHPPANNKIIADVKVRIEALKKATPLHNHVGKRSADAQDPGRTQANLKS